MPSSHKHTEQAAKPTASVSIICVCKNAERDIADTIQSVIQQSHTPIEFIVIDGDSSDQTMKIVQQAENGITKSISEPDNGIYHAMNKGVGLATGDFLLFLNAGDTLIDSESIKTAMTAIANSRNSDLYHAGVLWVDPDTGRTQKKPPKQATGLNLFRGSLNHQGMFIRRKLFDQIGPYDERFTLAGDYEWFVRALRKHHCQFVNIQTYVSIFKLGGLSTSGQHKHTIQSECQLVRDMYYSPKAANWYRPLIRIKKILGI